VFLKPLVAKFPDHVPGGVLLTDIWIYLNGLMANKLLCKPDTTPLVQAGVEASRCKRLIGALRYLYRNSFLVCGLLIFFLLEVFIKSRFNFTSVVET